MSLSFIYNKEKLQEWQSSSCMIPVLLELIKEKFVKMDQNGHDFAMQYEINAYQTIYQSWKKSHDLNSKQKEWVEQIGDYLNAIRQVLFRPPTTPNKSANLSDQTQLSNLKI